MPVLVGDSIVISSVGYQRQHYIVPDHSSEYLTIVIEMVQDVTFLREIEITPFPTEEVFKDRKSTRLNSSHIQKSRMPSSA